jgi:hypothetical protein
MRLSTIGRYLIGDRAAILEFGTDRSLLFEGALFVFSAALTRTRLTTLGKAPREKYKERIEYRDKRYLTKRQLR